jgi:hypothetical protein
MSESTERLPPMDHQRGQGGMKASQGQGREAATRPSRERSPELSPDRQPDFDTQEAARREGLQGGPSRPTKSAREMAELDSARTLARSQLGSLDDAMVDFALAHSDWVLDNVLEFLANSGGAGTVQFEGVAVERFATNLLRSSVQAVGRTVGGLVQGAVARSPAALSGGAMASRVAAMAGIFGGFTSVIISAAWGLVDAAFERQRINKLVDGATDNLSAAVRGAVAESRTAREEQLGLWHTRRDGLLNAVDDARTVEELQLLGSALPAMVASARQAAADLKKDRSLSIGLLAAWIKQTARDDEEAGKDVNPVSYAKAETEMRRSAPHLLDKSDLYVEQCRYEWGKLGVDATAALEALGRMKTRNYRPELVLAEAPREFRFTQLKKPSSLMAYLANHGHAPAPQVVREKTQRPAPRIDDEPDKREVVSHERAARTGGRPARLLDAVMHGKVDIVCRVELDASERSTFVDSFEYEMEFMTTSGGQEFVKLEVEP